MRCDDVVRELAVPTADRDRAAIAEHLAGCPACAGWARRAEGLDRFWEATRPAEPSAEAWDAIWANIAQAIPCPVPASERLEESPAPSRNGNAAKLLVHPAATPAPIPAGRPSRRRGWGLASIALVGLAQAAAILIALGLAWRAEPPIVVKPPAPDILAATPAAIRSEAPVDVNADVEAGCLMVIHVDEKSGRVEDRTPPEMNASVDFGMVITNEMEWIATPRMASQ